ncbi:Head-to-tail connector protein, podovirus-type [uncultured Caudovirales phage]|uniref:Head-to-tail connector protein, podovirus-type n=1 Tax=uncultured Caudovirales phage TaxID=2100421 RepID=A0A6J5S2V7_9CAUD|nr:Head-to-tail connector protein, podovirus-type [uncultured Caudovirales phage]CAB4169841.1 Head-to-tail connector protein, podovirus-type [uncultured Caudovirales phage]CAB4199444.1 Head-to-tail connector protein, podovirus-type [uncultured Caudovirales phage]
MQGTVTPSTEVESRLYDTTAVLAVQTLANGCLAWMSPQENPWFAFSPDELLNDESSSRWLSLATRITRESIGRSNFYTAIHEFYLDRSAFGTGCMYIEPGKKQRINAQCWPVGSYVVDEDDEGNIDTVIREFKLTPRQASMKFGFDALSPRMKEIIEKESARANDQFDFLHFIYPREEEYRTKGSILPKDMPIACVYLERETAHVCRVSGYDEMPVMVSRYLEWGSNMGNKYGWSPAFAALPEARQLNFIQKMMDALAEKAAFPPVLAPEELEGEIDPNAFGVTYFDANIANRLPKEWMTAGRYDIGKDRVLERQTAINKAFHVDLFSMFAQLNKQMTAREVAERSSEKLIQFSPTFARLTTELFNPLLERLFSIGIRSGWFGDIPEALLVDIGGGQAYIAPPQVLYSSRIALALRSLPVLSIHRMLELTVAMAQLDPSVADNFDFDAAWQTAAMNEALPEGVARARSQVEEIRQARQEQLAQQQQMEQAQAMTESTAKLGGMRPDNPVTQVFQQG